MNTSHLHSFLLQYFSAALHSIPGFFYCWCGYQIGEGVSFSTLYVSPQNKQASLKLNKVPGELNMSKVQLTAVPKEKLCVCGKVSLSPNINSTGNTLTLLKLYKYHLILPSYFFCRKSTCFILVLLSIPFACQLTSNLYCRGIICLTIFMVKYFI